MRNLLAAIGAICLLAACNAGAEESSSPDFRAALKAHFGAVLAHDLEGYRVTVTTEEELYHIYLDGFATYKSSDIVDFHERWFASVGDARWEVETLKVWEGEDLSAALLQHHFYAAPEAEPISAWLVVVFELQNGEWRLVHDQNTGIKNKETVESE